MSYDLHLHFESALEQRDFLQYFSTRRNFTASDSALAYQNPDTGVDFRIHYKTRKSLLGRKSVGSAHFEINYFRPSYFGLEAEIELSALVARFRPAIEDPQMKGMGQGPYSGEGFLAGWNFGNEFGVGAILAANPQHVVKTLPTARLHAAWAWNYNKAQWEAKVGERQFVPGVMLVSVDDTPALAVVWGLGMPVVLPKVDYVMVGREDKGVKRFGLATWSEVIAQLRRAALEVEGDPLDIKYPVTPAPIARWVATIPEFDLKKLTRLGMHEVIDSELVAAAQKPRA